MTFRGSNKVSYDSGPNMTPLVDVVMVILIFLMLAGSFGTNSHFLTSNLPVQGAGSSDPSAGPHDEFVDVRIHPDSNYGFQVIAGDIRSIGRVPDRDWLTRQFARKIRQYGAAGTPVRQLQLVLHPSDNVRFDQIALVYEAALAAKFEKVAFRTSQ